MEYTNDDLRNRSRRRRRRRRGRRDATETKELSFEKLQLDSL
jgi:hypothetical protein